MELTDRAEALWASYETEVRQRLEGRTDVDATDVLAGVREHVEAELSRRGVERATAEDLSEILERLGGPEQWDADVARPLGPADSSPPPRWPGVAALAFAALGSVLVLAGLWWAWAPGWGLIVAGVVLARVSLDHGDPEAGGEAATGPTRRLALLLWWVASVAAVLALLLTPALLVWSSAQVGGALEAVLPGRPGVPGAPSPDEGYWRLPALIGGSATAVWWLILAGVATRWGDAFRRLLGPTRRLVPRSAPRWLTLGAALLILVSLVLGVLS